MFAVLLLMGIIIICIIISIYFNNYTEDSTKIVYREINDCILEWVNEYNQGFYRI